MTHNIKKRNKEATMEKICQAAIDIFSSFGYENASTKQIAKQAGVNSALIFTYFGSKDGLFTYIYEQRLSGKPIPQESSLRTATIEGELMVFSEIIFKSVMENRNILRSMLFLRNYEEKFKTDGNYQQRTVALVKRLEEFKNEGKIRSDVDIEKFAIDFIHMVDGISLTFSIYSNESKEYTMNKISGLIKMLICGLSPR